MAISCISTRPALIKRGKKLLKEINSYFEDAAIYGLTTQDIDEDGMLQKIRAGLVQMLTREREGRVSRTPKNG